MKRKWIYYWEGKIKFVINIFLFLSALLFLISLTSAQDNSINMGFLKGELSSSFVEATVVSPVWSYGLIYSTFQGGYVTPAYVNPSGTCTTYSCLSGFQDVGDYYCHSSYDRQDITWFKYCICNICAIHSWKVF